MAHRRRPLGVALALNTVVLGVEFGAGTATASLSLIMDSAHNLSDETALALLSTTGVTRPRTVTTGPSGSRSGMKTPRQSPPDSRPLR